MVFSVLVRLNCLLEITNIPVKAVGHSCAGYETSFYSSVTAVEGFQQKSFHVSKKGNGILKVPTTN